MPHLTKIENRFSRNVGILKKLKHFSPTYAQLMSYYSIVYPHNLCCTIKWGSAYISLLNKLQLIRNKAVHAIYLWKCLEYVTSAICLLNCLEYVTPCCNRLNFLTIKNVAKLEIAKFVHKSVNYSLPHYFQILFSQGFIGAQTLY